MSRYHQQIFQCMNFSRFFYSGHSLFLQLERHIHSRSNSESLANCWDTELLGVALGSFEFDGFQWAFAGLE